MKMLYIYIIFASVWQINFVKSNKIPWDHKKSGAVIVTLEEAENARALLDNQTTRHISKLWPSIKRDKDLELLEQVLEDIEKGRGKSNKSHKKLHKFIYPLFMGVLIAKVVLIPLILKMLTAISASALVMSKIALITTGFLALKWIFSGTVHDGKDRLEFIYLPTSANGNPYRSASGGFSLWDDQSWSADSNNQYAAVVAAAAPSTPSQHQKYIPVNLKQHELPYNSYHRGGGVGKTGLSDAAVNDLYYYAQHNYNNNNDGKPFL